MCREVILHGDGGPAILGWTLFAKRPCRAVCGIWESSRWESAFFGDAPARRDHLQLACFEIASNSWVSRRHRLGAFPRACFWGNGHCWSMNFFLPLAIVSFVAIG